MPDRSFAVRFSPSRTRTPAHRHTPIPAHAQTDTPPHRDTPTLAHRHTPIPPHPHTSTPPYLHTHIPPHFHTPILPHCFLLAALLCSQAAADPLQTAQSFRSHGESVTPISDSTLLCEAEEFQVKTPGWKALPWGTNYYACTFANTFLSRQAYLGAPEECPPTSATLNVTIPAAGRYLALVRYEACPRFQTQFRLQIHQNGETKLDRLYGARDNLKIWAFGQKLQKEAFWSWGAVENIVWEGHDAGVDLEPGPAQLTLLAGPQPEPAARRNVDVIMLTRDQGQVQERIQKEGYLPLDGMLTQSGDVYFRLHNHPGSPALSLTVPNGIEHSSYWVHQRDWKPKTIAAAPGASSEWVEVGSLLDTLNDGQWRLDAKSDGPSHYDLEVGLKDSAGAITAIKLFKDLSGNVELAYSGNTRYSRSIGLTSDLLYRLVDDLKKQPVHGQQPQQTLVYASTFDPRPRDPRYSAALKEFIRLAGVTALTQNENQDALSAGPAVRGYIDLRDLPLPELEKRCQQLQLEGKANNIAVVSLGDEIGLQSPPEKDDAGFIQWLQGRGLKPQALLAEDWNQVHYLPGASAAAQPEIYYYSQLYRHWFGIQAQKARTDLIHQYLPNAGIGANYSPQGEPPYLGSTYQWVSLFQQGGMTMPWSEDYVWGVPIGSQQMNFLSLDLFRCGIRLRPEEKIQFYVMPHSPGNTPASWRRQFFGDIAHGAKIFNLFEYRPVQAAYTENHVDSPDMYAEVRRSLYEMGGFEDILQQSQVRPGLAGLWFSETADVWNDNTHPFAAAKRSLYIAIRHQQLPLDIVTETESLDGSLAKYRVLYLADRHVSQAASQAIARWVQAGGHLFATAGAGSLDEFNRPNKIMQNLFGVQNESLLLSPLSGGAPARLVPGQPPTRELAPEDAIRFEKQDLPFAQPVDTVTGRLTSGEITIPVFGLIDHFRVMDAVVKGKFQDGTPAITTRQSGTGEATYCGFLPGLSYFKPAIPLRPADRGAADISMAHFIPTQFDSSASRLIGFPALDVPRPILCSEPLVETGILESPAGVVIPLVNWSAGPVQKLTVRINIPLPFRPAALASGRPLQVSTRAGHFTFTLDLNTADALVLR